jgi:transcription elongation factor GreA
MDTVIIGSRITVSDEQSAEKSYQIVPDGQGSPTNGTLSLDSPVGRALKGHGAGDSVNVVLPHGKTRTLTLVSIGA